MLKDLTGCTLSRQLLIFKTALSDSAKFLRVIEVAKLISALLDFPGQSFPEEVLLLRNKIRVILVSLSFFLILVSRVLRSRGLTQPEARMTRAWLRIPRFCSVFKRHRLRRNSPCVMQLSARLLTS